MSNSLHSWLWKPDSEHNNTQLYSKSRFHCPFPLMCEKTEPEAFLLLFFSYFHAAFFYTAFRWHVFSNLGSARTTPHKIFTHISQQISCRNAGNLSPGWKGRMLSGVTRRNVPGSVWLRKSLFRLKHTSAIPACIHALMLAANGTDNSAHLSDFRGASWCWQFLWRSLKNSNDSRERRGGVWECGEWGPPKDSWQCAM